MMLLLILLVYLSHGHIKGVVVYIYTRPGNIKPACVHCTPLSHFPTNPETTKTFHFPGPFLRLFPENILNIQDLSSWDSISIPLPGHHWSCSISKTWWMADWLDWYDVDRVKVRSDSYTDSMNHVKSYCFVFYPFTLWSTFHTSKATDRPEPDHRHCPSMYPLPLTQNVKLTQIRIRSWRVALFVESEM